MASSKVASFRFFNMESKNDLKWHGLFFDKVGSDWVCRFCGVASNYRSRDTLRKGVRKRHNVSRCDAELRTQGEEAKETAIEKARDVGLIYMETFLDTLRPSMLTYTAFGHLPGNPASTRSRTRSLVNHARVENTATDMTDLCGCRVAKCFDGKHFFGSSRERIRGAVLQPTLSGIKEFQAVRKIEYDNGDIEQLIRKKIVAAMKLYRMHQKADTQNVPCNCRFG